MIAPSHGPIYGRPDFILDAYRDWVSSPPKNLVVIPYISMHGSTKVLVDRLVSGLTDRGVNVARFDLAFTDVGKLAIELVDAATIVIATPTVLGGPHPSVVFATYLANVLRPKVKFASIIGSYGWGGKAVEMLSEMMPFLKVEVLDPVTCKGLPREEDLAAVDDLADKIAARHRDVGLLEAVR
jgi:flavorubredoxin